MAAPAGQSQLMPYPIYDMQAGEYEARQPWLSPPQAWKEVLNAYLFRGRMQKRGGYTYFSELGYPYAETPGTGNAEGTAGAPYSESTVTTVVVPLTVTIEDTTAHNGNTKWVHDDGNGVLLDLSDGDAEVGTINYTTGAIVVNALAVAFDSNVTISYGRNASDEVADNAVMGMHSMYPRDGGEFFFAFDTRRMWSYSTSTSTFEMNPAFTADFWSGDRSDHMWAYQYNDILMLTNRVNEITYHDGSNLKIMHIDWDHKTGSAPGDPQDGTGTSGRTGSYDPTVDTCTIIVWYKNRIVLLAPDEDGGVKPQRARWSEVNPVIQQSYVGGDVYPFPAGFFSDAPTPERITSAGFLGDDLFVFFETSVWRLSWNDDFRQPFIWEKVSESEGSLSRMGTINRPDRLFTTSATRINMTDGRDVVVANADIPDRILDWNLEALEYAYAHDADELRLAIFAYAAKNDTYPENALVYQYEEGGWSTFDFPFHTYGYYEFSGQLTWNQINETWNETHTSWNERSKAGGFPATVAGDRECKIWFLFDGLLDDGESIRMRAKTQRLNPYTGQGGAATANARMAQCDIIAKSAPGASLTVRFYADYDSVPYLVHTMPLDPIVQTTDKVRRQLLVNRSAMYHMIEIEHTGPEEIKIDAVVPWFEPDGGARIVG